MKKINENLIVKIKKDEENKRVIKVPANVRKTLDGCLLFKDHPHIYISVSPEDKKIYTYPKEEYGDIIYESSERLFEYLISKGVIAPDSYQGSKIFGGFEAVFPESKTDANATEVILYTIAVFLEEEQERFSFEEQYDKMQTDALLKPDQENSTELGEVPQRAQKGTIPSPLARRTIARY